MKYCYYLLFIIPLFVGCKNAQKEDTVKPIYKDISELVYASANVVSQNKYQCRSSRSGIIQEILVEKGEVVKKGQPLFRISATADAKNRLNNATVSLTEVESNLYGSNNKLNSIVIELQKNKEQNLIDSINYQRRKRLWDQNIGSKSDLERTLLAYQSSSSRIDALRLEYEQVKVNLENNVEKARNQVSTERSLLEDLVIKSEIDGEVFTVLKEVGEYITPQEVFAEIGNVNNYIIQMNIDEVDISKINLGDTAIIHLEAYPDKVFTSILSFISHIKDQSTQTFMVESVFAESPSKLFSGLGGEANILVERRKNAKVIPSMYLVGGNKVLTENGEVNVSVGVKNLEFVEILDGIDTSITLLKPDVQ